MRKKIVKSNSDQKVFQIQITPKNVIEIQNTNYISNFIKIQDTNYSKCILNT